MFVFVKNEKQVRHDVQRRLMMLYSEKVAHMNCYKTIDMTRNLARLSSLQIILSRVDWPPEKESKQRFANPRENRDTSHQSKLSL